MTRPLLITDAEAKRIFRRARENGFNTVRIEIDRAGGKVVIQATDAGEAAGPANPWDEVFEDGEEKLAAGRRH